jgi:hypothetical protein
MDPKETLKDILLTAQRIGQPMDKAGLTIELAALLYNVENLIEWFEKGGYKPELYVTIEGLDE